MGTARRITVALIIISFAPGLVTASSIAFVEHIESATGAPRYPGFGMPASEPTAATGKLFRIDPANPTPFLVVDLSQEVFGAVRAPAFSPDGRWIAFASEEDLMSTPWRSNLWIVDRNAEERFSVTHKTPGSFPAGSPTGSVEGAVYEDGYAKSGAWVYISSLTTSVTADTWGRYRFENVPIGEQYVTAYDPIILYDNEDFGFMPVTVYEGVTSGCDVTFTWDWDDQQGVKGTAWTPSGQELLFIDNAGGANRIRPDGGGLAELVAVPQGVTQFTGIAVNPTNGSVALMTDVWWGDDNLKGVWICNADGSAMRQVISDPSISQYSGLHWSPDGSLFGFMTMVTNEQDQTVPGVLFYSSNGSLAGGIALDDGWQAEFGGWDPSMQYVTLALYPTGEWLQTNLITVRLSDYTSSTLFGPTDIRYPSWGPEASSVDDGPAVGEFVLGPAFPNPAREAVHLRMEGTASGPVSVGVFDLLGRRVAVVAGESALRWDCRDDCGTAVPPGTYLFHLLNGSGTPRPVIVIR